MLPVDVIGFDAGGGQQRRRIHDFECLTGKSNDLLLAKGLKGPADVNVGEPERLTELTLAQRKMESLARLVGQVVSKPDVNLEQQMSDSFPGAAQSEVGQMIVRPRLVRGDLATKQKRKTWIVLDNRVELAPRESKNPGGRKTTCGVVHRL